VKNSNPFEGLSSPIICGLFVFLTHVVHAAAPVIDSASPSTYLSTSSNTNVTLTGSGFAVPVFRSFLQMTRGSGHSCAIDAVDHQAYCWGANGYGQLGNGHFEASRVPIAVDTSGALAGKTIKHISASSNQTCVVASDNRAYCWGNNDYGQLGNEAANDGSAVPIAVDTSGVLAGKLILQVEAGAVHTCALTADGRVYCWGSNDWHQLGNGSDDDSSKPVAVDMSGVLSGKTIKQITTRGSHTCAIASNDQAYCWGDSIPGNGTWTINRVPVAVDTSGVLAGKTIRQISAGNTHTCAIASDARAYCWGFNDNGQLGNGSIESPGACAGQACSLVPVAVDTSGVLAGKTLRRIATGSNHTCAIASDDKAYCWGDNISAELGAAITDPCGNYSNPCSAVPVAVDTSGVLGGKSIQKVATGGGQSCVIDTGRQAYCWGSGWLGDGSLTTSPAPAIVISWLPATATIAGVPASNVVVWTDDTLTFTASPQPAGAYPLEVTVDSVTTSLPLTLTYGSAAPLGIAYVSPNDNLVGQETITAKGGGFLREGTTSFTQIASGYDHTCAIASTDHQAYCWGNNASGQLGNGSLANEPIAVDTSGVLSDKTIRQLAAGSSHSCAIASDGRAYCWGQNAAGQLGNGSFIDSAIPVAVDITGALAGKTILQITAGEYETCVIASDDRAYCWGQNGRGQLGDGSFSSSPIPVAVDTSGALAGLSIQSIGTGGRHSCAVASNGHAYCWGSNVYGQLGAASSDYCYATPCSMTPIAVNTSGALAGKTIQQIATGLFHTCAIASDSRAYCWGGNANGPLGNNSDADSYVPVAVDTSGALAGKIIRQIATGLSHTCAVATDGREYCWGLNLYGQLGGGHPGYYRYPVATDISSALAGKTITQTTAGGEHTCAVTSGDEVYCWGNNDKGQLGRNTSIAPGHCYGYGSQCSDVPIGVVNGLLPTVTVGGVPASNVTVVDDTTLTFTTPWMLNGTYDLTVDYGTDITNLSDALNYFVVDPIFKSGFEQL